MKSHGLLLCTKMCHCNPMQQTGSATSVWRTERLKLLVLFLCSTWRLYLPRTRTAIFVELCKNRNQSKLRADLHGTNAKATSRLTIDID